MTAAVLRPNGTIAGADSVTVAASAHAATSDDLDTTWYTDDDTTPVHLNLGTVTIGAGSITKQLRYRWRGRSDAAAVMSVGLTVAESGGTVIDSSTHLISTTLTDYSGSYAPVSLSQSTVDGLTIKTDRRSSTVNAYRVYELYVDLVYVTIPVTVVTAVSPDPYTASTIVPIAWTNTLDSDGGDQTRYEVKVFTDAQYGAVGFDPATSTPYYETGQVVSSALTVDVGPVPNDTYRAYVRVAQTVNSASHWSAWAYDEFTMNVTTSDVSTVTPVATNADGKITVTVARNGATAAWKYIEVQRSTDAGATWADVRGATYVDATGDANSFVVVDYETPNGTSTLYRARATYLSSGLPITGAWVESSAVTWTSTDTWLKAPDDPTLNMTLCMSARTPYRRNRRSGVFQVLGRVAPVTVSDVRSSRSGSVVVETETTAEADDLVALLDGSAIVLVQFPASMDIADKYVVVLSDEELFRSIVADNVWREWSIEYVEVVAPADPDAGR